MNGVTAMTVPQVLDAWQISDPYELIVDMTTMPGDQFEVKYPGLAAILFPDDIESTPVIR